MTITKRGDKGSALTYNEMDENIRDLYEDTDLNRVVTNGNTAGNTVITTDSVSVGTEPTSNQASSIVRMTNEGIFAPNPLGYKNLIINGDASVCQRDIRTDSNRQDPTTGSYLDVDILCVGTRSVKSVDMWHTRATYNGQMKIAWSTDVPSGQHFQRSIKVKKTSGGSSGSFYLTQCIESINLNDLMYGSSDAKTLTLSFWIKCSVTGNLNTIICQEYNGEYVWIYPEYVTINAADTWEYKTLTIPGNTNSNGYLRDPYKDDQCGLSVNFVPIHHGISYKAPRGTWFDTNRLEPGTTFGKATSGSDILWDGSSTGDMTITGVQLERGSHATPFEFEPFTRQLEKCQRFFWNVHGAQFMFIAADGKWERDLSWTFPVPMRAKPAFYYSSVSHGSVYAHNTSFNHQHTRAVSVGSDTANVILYSPLWVAEYTTFSD